MHQQQPIKTLTLDNIYKRGASIYAKTNISTTMVTLIQTLTSCKNISPSLIHFHQITAATSTPTTRAKWHLPVRAYMENSNSISGFANKVIGSLPVIGLVARILNDEGGVGSDIVDFAEFRRRVGKKCSINDSRAFYDFQDRRGKV